ncbi:MAG: hypothetical protein NTY37_07045 [Methanothrix sp.]|nr:hypothetical protein [Methanothrix sp.]
MLVSSSTDNAWALALRPGSPVGGGQAGPEPGKRSCEGAGGPVEPEGQVELASGEGSFPGAGF